MSSAVARAPLRRRLRLLAHGRFRLLFLATLGSSFGSWLALIALQVDVYDRTRSGWWVAALLVATILPAVFIGLLLGPLVDRLSRKGLMIGSDLCRTAVFATLPFAGSPGQIVLLTALAGIGNGFYRPAVRAGLPNLVGEDDLPLANAALQLTDWVSTALGPLLGGVLVASSGPHLAYWVNAATFALSAALVAGIPGALLQSERAVGNGAFGDLAEGYRVVRRSAALTCVLVAWSIVMVGTGIVNLAEVFLARVSYAAGDVGFGLLWAGSGVGLVLGGLSANRLSRRGLGTAYVRSLLVFAAGIAGAAAAPGLWLGVAAMAVAGFGNGCAVIANVTLVQRSAADRVRGRVFTLLISANTAALAASIVAAGPLTDAVGARWAYAVAAGAILCAALIALRFVRTRGIEFGAGVQGA